MNDFSFYFRIGWDHIITTEALDHILFVTVLAAIYLLRDWKQVLILVTAFTVGHAITLLLSARGLVDVNVGWVEFLVPCTIIVTAITNLFQKNFTPRSIRINYFLALFFGLIHGLAFAETLKMILAGDQDFITAWISFSIGLELGQIAVVLLVLLLAELSVRYLRLSRRKWVLTITIGVLGTALWMAAERWPASGKEPGLTLHLRDGKGKQPLGHILCQKPFVKFWTAGGQNCSRLVSFAAGAGIQAPSSSKTITII